jgi:hypothetical protein
VNLTAWQRERLGRLSGPRYDESRTRVLGAFYIVLGAIFFIAGFVQVF